MVSPKRPLPPHTPLQNHHVNGYEQTPSPLGEEGRGEGADSLPLLQPYIQHTHILPILLNLQYLSCNNNLTFVNIRYRNNK